MSGSVAFWARAAAGGSRPAATARMAIARVTGIRPRRRSAVPPARRGTSRPSARAG
jgi:hypothetical protein